MREKISREKGFLDLLFSVFSANPDFQLGEKSSDWFLLEALIDDAFMPTPNFKSITFIIIV
jgi:hypothetical protein